MPRPKPFGILTVDQFEQILLKHWGYSGFRSIQAEVIRSVCGGHDTLALMPTGGGKSITFQVPALARPGICLVVTPLIALMRDQVEHLRRRGIKAMALHSGMSRHELGVALDNCAYGDYKFLYLSPERIGTELFRVRVKKMVVNLVAIDEAHCISQWGYDFRPSYLTLHALRELLPGVPFLAVTATATPDVVSDIQDKLGFRHGQVFRMSFERQNLVYIVRRVEDKLKQLLRVVNGLPGSGVVYVRNRQKAKEVAEFLGKAGASADYYHAGLSADLRASKQSDWQHDRTRIIVSTNAFGMGIDKPDVRFVVHLDLPDSPEAYFQEAGRGGRDGQRAYAVLLYNETDRAKVAQRIATAFPEPQEIRACYQALCAYLSVAVGGGKGEAYDFNLMDFAATFKLNVVKAHSALKALEMEGYIELTDEIDNPSRIMVLVDKGALQRYQRAHADLDEFIKLLLRNYAGLFSSYVRIDEQHLAKLAGLPPASATEKLIRLSRARLISYIPRKRTPLIIFTEERLEEKNVLISRKRYHARRARYTKRIEAMLAYASGNTECRSRTLLEYFGQADAARCGKCDTCTARNELGLSRFQFESVLEALRERLAAGPMPLEGLVDSLPHPPDRTLRVIQWLTDNGQLVHTHQGGLAWRQG